MVDFRIEDLEKALKFARQANAETIKIGSSSYSTQLFIEVAQSYKGASSMITIYPAEAAKMPTISKTETLF